MSTTAALLSTVQLAPTQGATQLRDGGRHQVISQITDSATHGEHSHRRTWGKRHRSDARAQSAISMSMCQVWSCMDALWCALETGSSHTGTIAGGAHLQTCCPVAGMSRQVPPLAHGHGARSSATTVTGVAATALSSTSQS